MSEPADQPGETTDPQVAQVPAASGAAVWVVSLLFWLSLLVSVLMYASVALSPKLADWIRIRQQYVQNAGRLVQLEEHVDYLERVAATLRSDPEFARRLAEASIIPQASGRQLLPVTRELLFGNGITPPTVAAGSDSKVPIIRPVVEEAVHFLATDQPARHWLLAGSVILTVISFTFLNESGRGVLQASGQLIARFATTAVRRYVRGSTSTTAEMPESETALPEVTGQCSGATEELIPVDNNCGIAKVASTTGEDPQIS